MSATPVSTERVRDLLSSRDLNFGEYSEAELVVPTRNAVYFWNTSNPQILQVRAQWRGIAEDDTQFSALVDEIASCNSTRSGPKAYLAPLEDSSRYGLIAECNVVAMDGLTQAQLDGFYETSLSMIMGFFADLEKALPDFVTWADDAENTNDAGDATEQAKPHLAASVPTVEEDQE
ncbi:YbjN domain-containing protein [Schaalia cardiffensis]